MLATRQILTLAAVLLNILGQVAFCFVIVPIPDIGSISAPISEDVATAIDELRRAVVPQSVNTAIAIAISDGVAGVVGGAVSRKAADILGDKKKDTLQTKLSTTGAFFGTRALIRGLSRLVGLPRPLALLCSSVVGSLVSEFTKQQGRSRSLDIDSPIDEEEKGLRVSEISGDITKWLVYDYLDEQVARSFRADDELAALLITTFGIGCIAAITSFVVKEIGEGMNNADLRQRLMKLVTNTGTGTKLVETAVEGGVLFATFQATLMVINMIVPPDFNKEFAFNSLIESIEKKIDPDLIE